MKQKIQKKEPRKGRLSLWHTAFVEAMQLDLKPWKDFLRFEPEYLLNAAPFAVDLLIIKKEADFVINNKIADIFKTHNIIEYKRPSAYISIHDFNKVCGYAYFYSALHKVDVRDITITFAGNRYPSKV